jgi:hypothetical protein
MIVDYNETLESENAGFLHAKCLTKFKLISRLGACGRPGLLPCCKYRHSHSRVSQSKDETIYGASARRPESHLRARPERAASGAAARAAAAGPSGKLDSVPIED